MQSLVIYHCILQQFSTIYWLILMVALVVKNPPANAGDTRDVVPSLGQKDPLEEGMASHSSLLVSGSLWTKEPGGLQYIPKRWTWLKWLSMHMHSTLILIFDCLFIRIMLQHFLWGKQKDKSVFPLACWWKYILTAGMQETWLHTWTLWQCYSPAVGLCLN